MLPDVASARLSRLYEEVTSSRPLCHDDKSTKLRSHQVQLHISIWRATRTHGVEGQATRTYQAVHRHFSVVFAESSFKIRRHRTTMLRTLERLETSVDNVEHKGPYVLADASDSITYGKTLECKVASSFEAESFSAWIFTNLVASVRDDPKYQMKKLELRCGIVLEEALPAIFASVRTKHVSFCLSDVCSMYAPARSFEYPDKHQSPPWSSRYMSGAF